ncbi:MAG: peptidoglycan-binding protein [Chromatiaceae bacterium]|nr:peptidoglycan-binding protein [Gammaproteobacteria bacterium]MCP5300193.1 peptidoglycan-binding protein [Chromatiaceae bacterium]MCP5422265.1 peptidoglycan-binding protein [Chromatiaceae bacterium]
MESLNKFQRSCLAAAVLALSSGAGAEPVDATTTLPNAKPGECYAKVVIPAQYNTENVDVVVREASVRFETIPAEYDEVEEKVLVKEAAKKIVPVPAEYEVASETIEVVPARKEWLAGHKRSAVPASPMLMAAIGQSGIKLDELEVGSCLSEYYVPPQYKNEDVRVLKTAAFDKIEVEPAAYEWVEEKVLVKEASKKVVEVPAEFDTVTEQVLVKPATTAWKTGRGLVERIDNTTGEIVCLVEIPAQYKTVERKVIKTPATTKEIEIPAEYKVQRVQKLMKPAQERRVKVEPTYETLSKTVKVADEKFFWHPDWEDKPASGKATGNTVCLRETPAKMETIEQRKVKTPASIKEVEIPAEYKSVKVRKLVKQAEQKKIEIPAVIETVAKRVKVADERLEWRKVLCETNMTKDIMTSLQNALKAAGYNPGPVDGEIGAQTMRAVDDYQRAKGLERGGLTLTTLESLGVKL